MRLWLITLLAVLATLSGLALAARPPAEQAPSAVRVEQRAGVFGQENSRAGQSVLSVSDIVPGQSRSGTVTIRNTGDSAQAFTLVQSAPVDTAGAGGASLSQNLRLTVDDLTSGRRVYDGSLAGLTSAAAGDLPAGVAHTFRFVAALPAGAPGSALAGATSAVDYQWRAEDAAATGTGTPDPAAPPPGGGPAPGTGTLVGPGAGRRVLGLGVVLTRADEVGSRRRLRLRLGCDRACLLTVRARLSIARSRRRLSFQTKVVPLAANRPATVTLRLSRSSARQVRTAMSRRRAVTIRVTVSGRDAAGNARRATYRLRVRR